MLLRLKHCFWLGALLLMAAPLKVWAQNNKWFVWTNSTALPPQAGLSHAVSGVSNGVLLLAGGDSFDKPIQSGGFKKVYDDVYIAKSNTSLQWQAVGKLPMPLANAAFVSVGDGILVIGGTNGKQTLNNVFLLRWNAVSGKIEFNDNYAKLPVSLSALSAAKIGSRIYIAGGLDSSGAARHCFYSLELAGSGAGNKSWQQLPAWPGPARFGAALVAQSNGETDCLYFFGGKGGTAYLKDAFAYHPKSNKWKTLASMPRPALYSAALAVGQTHVALFSGSDGHEADKAIALGNAYRMNNSVLAYHTITNTWTKLENLPTGVAGAAIVKWNNKVLLLGGELRPGVRTNQVQAANLQSAREKSKFGIIDYSTLVLYLVVLAGISYYFSRQKKASANYLLGSQNIPFWAAGISIMATQVSAIGFMSIPAKAYAVNWAYFAGVFTWFLAVPIVTRAYIPFIRKLNVASAYHYLEERFNGGTRMFAAAVFMFYQLARMGLVLYLPALALAAVTPLDTLTCILIMGVLSTAYTVMGGIEAVIWIEVVQATLLFGGAVICIVLAVLGLKGGMSDFFTEGIADSKFSLGSANWDFTSSSLIVILIGNVFIRLGNLTSDQAVVQRYMTTSSLEQARRSVWMDVVVSIPWAVVIYGLGTALYIYYKQHPAELNPSITTDGILPMFIARHAPVGLSGLIIAGIFAASMSTLEGHIHSVATIFTTDFYGKYKAGLGQKETKRVAKTATLIIGTFATGLSALLVFIDVNSILDVFQEITGLFIGASTALFMLGIFTTRANAAGALIGAASSGIILYFVKTHTPLSFWLYSAIGFLSCYFIGYLASCIIAGKKGLQGLTYYTINDNLKEY